MPKMRIALIILAFSIAIPSLASGHRPIFSKNKAIDPGTSIHIEDPNISQVVYRELSKERPSLWLDMDLGKNFDLYVQIGVPLLERLHRFRPAAAIIGPGLPSIALPFEIPKGTGGILLRTDDVQKPREFHEHFTGTDSWILRSWTLSLKEAGKYYLVAFSPQKDHGKLWLSVGQRESFEVADILRFPGWRKRIRAFHELEPKTGGGVAVKGPPEPDSGDVLGILASAGRFAILLKAIDKAGMSAVLKRDGPFTVFAPTDAAFGILPEGLLDELMKSENKKQLKDLLQRHVLKGRIFLSHQVLGTLAGDSIRVQHPGFILAGGAKVLHPDIPASNGIVHVVDGVLIRGTDLENRARSQAKTMIEANIELGTKLFNSGNVSDCVAVYGATVRALESLLADDPAASVKDEIASALEGVLKIKDQQEEAWRYRKILDDICSRLQDVSEKEAPNNAQSFLIDDFSSERGISTFGSRWDLFTDRVMGGISSATSRYEAVDGSRCLVLRGNVSLENNGGFIQVALSLKKNGRPFDAGGYHGIRLRARGNEQSYYVHLRTTQSRLPWQYYSAPFHVNSEWRLVDIPFDTFVPQNLAERLDATSLIRIGIVGAKKEYKAEVAVSRLELYR